MRLENLVIIIQKFRNNIEAHRIFFYRLIFGTWTTFYLVFFVFGLCILLFCSSNWRIKYEEVLPGKHLYSQCYAFFFPMPLLFVWFQCEIRCTLSLFKLIYFNPLTWFLAFINTLNVGCHDNSRTLTMSITNEVKIFIYISRLEYGCRFKLEQSRHLHKIYS